MISKVVVNNSPGRYNFRQAGHYTKSAASCASPMRNQKRKAKGKTTASYSIPQHKDAKLQKAASVLAAYEVAAPANIPDEAIDQALVVRDEFIEHNDNDQARRITVQPSIYFLFTVVLAMFT
ncbi:12669_t:CDS:2 [Ambispora gerdemannii]|uniref:12664_t:CDS:1 n=1 Tax=Ambispora gerdemannii TaxID=144530 RepID=A0A9N9BA98_9GLOM|nr:12664_t:CDS:2 [Ambispora gerdemannii]CAG8559062.1 12669_t:CDS:2 [Ambispora gerdemannii]